MVMSMAESARLLAILWRVQKDSVDVARLRDKLRASYRKAYMTEARGAIAEAVTMLSGMGGEIDSAEAGELLSVMERRLGSEGEGLAARLLNESVTIVRDVFTLTAREATGKTRYNLRLTDNRAIRIMREHDVVWMRGHYQDKLHGEFKSAVDEVMRTGYSRGKLATELAGRLGGVVEGDTKYFSDLADHTVTKAREIGRIAGFEEAGITEVRVRAVMDAKTSPVCRSMNGRIIEIQHLTAQRDDILAAKSPTDLKGAAAWAAPFHGKTDELPKNIGIPPYHYRCRTTLMAVVKSIKVTATHGATMRPDHRQRIDELDDREHAMRIGDIRNGLKDGRTAWAEGALDTHAARHARTEEFDESDEAYHRRTMDTIRSASGVFVQAYPKGLSGPTEVQYVFASAEHNCLAIVSTGAEILSSRPMGSFSDSEDKLLADYLDDDARKQLRIES